MKILTKEEEQAHYNATLKGGSLGGALGLAAGGAVLFAANRRYHTIRHLTIPMKAFLVTSVGTFSAIIAADRASRSFETDRDPSRRYRDKASTARDEVRQSESVFQRAKDWGRENRYPIVTASWVASMGVALGLVGRDPYLTGAQKLVQARVYAQGLTIAILLATAMLEVGDASKGKGRWETVKIIDPNDPEHKHLIEKRIHHEAYEGEDLWRDMVATEERKIEERKKEAKRNGQDSKKPADAKASKAADSNDSKQTANTKESKKSEKKEA